MFPLFCPGKTLDSRKPRWLMAVAKSLRALENKRQGAWTEERCWAFPLARFNIHSPAGRSQGAGWGGEARWLCSPCCYVRTANFAEAGHEAFSVVSWIWKREHLFFSIIYISWYSQLLILPTHKSGGRPVEGVALHLGLCLRTEMESHNLSEYI